MILEQLMINDWVNTSYQDNPIRQVTPEMLNMTQDEVDRWTPLPLSEAFFKGNKFRLKSETDEDGTHIKHYRRSVSMTYNINIYVLLRDNHYPEFIIRVNSNHRKHRHAGRIDAIHEFQHILRDCDLVQLANSIKPITPKTPTNNDQD